MALPSLSRMAYFYPRPPRGGRPDVPAVCPSIFTISIHALREEGDPVFWYRPRSVLEFLSTPSARRATWRPSP